MANELTNPPWVAMPEEHGEWRLNAIRIRSANMRECDNLVIVPADFRDIVPLLSAAPEMLAECEYIVGQYDDYPGRFAGLTDDDVARLKAIIAKARGG